MLKIMNSITYTAIFYSSTNPLYVYYFIFFVKDSQYNLEGTMNFYVSTTFNFILELDSALVPIFVENLPCNRIFVNLGSA